MTSQSSHDRDGDANGDDGDDAVAAVAAVVVTDAVERADDVAATSLTSVFLFACSCPLSALRGLTTRQSVPKV